MKTALLLLLGTLATHAELSVTVSPPKVTGQKAVVLLAITNGLPQKVESARVVVFVLDEQGQMVGQATRWIIGGSEDKQGLAPGATNTFNFVVTSVRPLATTNLTAKASFNRVVLEGGKIADLTKDAVIK